MNIPNRKSKEVSKKYAVERNTFKRAVKADKERRIDLEIGDSKSDDFKPQVKTSWFGNSYNRSIRAAEHPSAKVRTSGNKIIYETPEYDVVQYEKPDAGEEGGHELEWVLPKKPRSNVLPFTLRYKGDVRFYFQPPLTQKEKDNGAHRPENVENSYAVYIDKQNHRKGGNNYATGKIEHIYRPKAIDADGNEVWCELNIPEEGEVETNIACNVTVPNSFLDKAVYPVVVDPTFGYTGAGSSSIGLNESSRMWGNTYTMPENGDVSSLSAYINNFFLNDFIEYGIYSSSTDALLAQSGEQEGSFGIGSTAGWATLSVSLSMSNGTTYTLMARGEPDSSFNSRTVIYYDGSAASDSYWSKAATSFPDPFDGLKTSSTATFSIYATYTASSSNTAPTANNDTATTAYETTVKINVLSNDTDPEGDPLTVDSITSAPSNGTATIQGDDTIDYTPDNGFSGDDTFIYEISDDGGLTDTATVTVTVNATTPTVTTSAADNITTTSADGNGNITDTGGADASERGFVYSTTTQTDPGNTSPAASAYESVANETGTFSTGTFSLSLTGLTDNTTYYVRAYAENSEGYSYGGEVSFTTLEQTINLTATQDDDQIDLEWTYSG